MPNGLNLPQNDRVRIKHQMLLFNRLLRYAVCGYFVQESVILLNLADNSSLNAKEDYFTHQKQKHFHLSQQQHQLDYRNDYHRSLVKTVFQVSMKLFSLRAET